MNRMNKLLCLRNIFDIGNSKHVNYSISFDENIITRVRLNTRLGIRATICLLPVIGVPRKIGVIPIANLLKRKHINYAILKYKHRNIQKILIQN